MVDIDRAEVAARVTDLMGKKEVPIQFRRKTFDLRPLIGSLSVSPASAKEPDLVHLDAVLLRDERGRTGRPDVLIQALELEPNARRMVRKELVFEP